ncbi:uncharacterized protein LOC114749325 [Neltuma alba]|uniref:uncharacterized protein LOC114749325 n=1 Tax=Neltuma alba TaxID=207710 RepID=UPI0010A53657|nr:uncharacterized protein LOC114749325 [Prosopis alba]
MTRGKQKIEAQRRNAERNQKPKGSQLEARAVGLKVICPVCKVYNCGSWGTACWICYCAFVSGCFLRSFVYSLFRSNLRMKSSLGIIMAPNIRRKNLLRCLAKLHVFCLRSISYESSNNYKCFLGVLPMFMYKSVSFKLNYNLFYMILSVHTV